MKRFLWVLTLIAGGITLFDLTQHPAPQAIYNGQPVVYWLYVNVFDRLPWALVGMAVLGALVFLRRVVPRGDIVTVWLMLVWSMGVLVFTLVAPIITLVNGSNAIHLMQQTADGRTVALYLQPSQSVGCGLVLMQCGADQLVCSYRAHVMQPVCLGRYSPVQLQAADGEIRVIENGEIVLVVTSAIKNEP